MAEERLKLKINVMLVDDSVVCYGPVAFRQNWHLRKDAVVHWGG